MLRSCLASPLLLLLLFACMHAFQDWPFIAAACSTLSMDPMLSVCCSQSGHLCHAELCPGETLQGLQKHSSTDTH